MARNSHLKKRKHLTKDQLLPLPAESVRALSLEAHIALSVLRRGRGEAMQIGCLAKTIYLAYFMRDITPGAEIDQFQTAELIVENCIDRALRGEQWELRETDYSAIERILLLYDAQLAAAPAYRFADAWQKFLNVVVGSSQTPIDGSRVKAPTVGFAEVSELARESVDSLGNGCPDIESR